MKHKNLILVPIVLAAGIYVGHRFGHSIAAAINEHCGDAPATDNAAAADQPVYLRETLTDGQGL
ncbi:hypothetical protein [Lapidilactobacillus luobeiensis]|uniref:hypothetical protein n=1 Tax=Lapidilactobacillus luobeiensis TaxID=2950371 RepID=UPI0021C35D23|nr:hypothetical protein [Lapidilactobacillus luobeiensis]